jgi:hypothetical protein
LVLFNSVLSPFGINDKLTAIRLFCTRDWYEIGTWTPSINDLVFDAEVINGKLLIRLKKWRIDYRVLAENIATLRPKSPWGLGG